MMAVNPEKFIGYTSCGFVYAMLGDGLSNGMKHNQYRGKPWQTGKPKLYGN
jgi:hypothetical protein